MAPIKLAVAFSMIALAPPLSAATSQEGAMAPEAGPDARYCLRVEPATGSLIETVRCWTREKWADQGVDVDKEWAKEGVSVIA